MNELRYLQLIRGESHGIGPALARSGLSALGLGYRLGVNLRNGFYDRGWFKQHVAALPIISIGNLTLGGTGKTPMAEWIARWLRQQDVRVALLSRGYRSRSSSEAGLNDEGLVLDQNLPDVPHLQSPDRVESARIASEELMMDLAILDDGFQHRRLKRDLDIVLLDALDPFGLGRLCPRGLLREPISSLKRANLIVLTRADLINSTQRDQIWSKVRQTRTKAELAEARHAPLDLINEAGESQDLESLSAQKPKVAAFCGIGNPEGFRRTLELAGLEPVVFRAFPDHHGYEATDISNLNNWVQENRVDLALTTQKDLVKLRLNVLGPIPLFAMRVGIQFLNGQDRVEQALSQLAAKALANRSEHDPWSWSSSEDDPSQE